MKESNSGCLSASFFAARGVSVTEPFSQWVRSAALVARTRSSEAERGRYERWIIALVEDVIRVHGGVSTTNWTNVSVCMPHDAEDRTPIMFRPDGNGSTTCPLRAVSSEHRTLLYGECVRRIPQPLHPLLNQAFANIDVDVANGKRRYDTVTVLEVVNAVQELQSLYDKKVVVGEKQRHREQRQPLPSTTPASGMTGTARDSVSGRKTARGPSNVPPSVRVAPAGSDAPKGEVSDRGPVALARFNTHRFFADMVAFGDPEPPPPQFVGKSQKLERLYSRYEPAAEDIRPREVLVEAFKHITSKANDKEQFPEASKACRYLSDQLKGMRQDLCVQNIVDRFAIEVYEKHALISLELGDIGEFNQCQASLKKMYENAPECVSDSAADFFCYRLTYLALSSQFGALATELIQHNAAIMARRNEPERRTALRITSREVRNTLKLCGACEEGNCHEIVRLLARFQPGMCSLVRIYLPRYRPRWLGELVRCIRGGVTLYFIAQCLGFTPVSVATASGDTEVWLDGTAERAEDEFKHLFEMIKHPLPQGWSLREEIKRRKKFEDTHQSQGDEAEKAVDAQEVLTCVMEYMKFLGTRSDARFTAAE